MRSETIYSVYGHRVAYKPIEDFCSGLPGGQADYLEELKELALRLYARRSKSNARYYFLDKTPRYHMIAFQFMQMFPDSAENVVRALPALDRRGSPEDHELRACNAVA
jgi:hypothetical protein